MCVFWGSVSKYCSWLHVKHVIKGPLTSRKLPFGCVCVFVSTLWTHSLFRSLPVGPCSHGDRLPAGFAESVWSPPALEGKLALSFHQWSCSIKYNGSESSLAAQSCHMTSWGTTGSVFLLLLLGYWDRWAGWTVGHAARSVQKEVDFLCCWGQLAERKANHVLSSLCLSRNTGWLCWFLPSRVINVKSMYISIRAGVFSFAGDSILPPALLTVFLHHDSSYLSVISQNPLPLWFQLGLVKAWGLKLVQVRVRTS